MPHVMTADFVTGAFTLLQPHGLKAKGIRLAGVILGARRGGVFFGGIGNRHVEGDCNLRFDNISPKMAFMPKMKVYRHTMRDYGSNGGVRCDQGQAMLLDCQNDLNWWIFHHGSS